MWNGSTIIRQSNVMGLPGTLCEFYAVGFQKPMDGDQVLVEARISLPCGQGSKEIDDRYCFGEAVMLCGAPLVPSWGKELVQGVRTMSLMVSGDTFAEAFEGLEKDVQEALRPLATAFYERKERLKVAEWRP
jgi:hypothetical protein